MELTLDQALQKGIEAHKAGKAQEADRYYSAVLKANPKHPDVNHNMGVLAVGVGKVEAALSFFKTALEVNPNIAQYWLSYIDALIKLDRITDAKAVFDQAKSKGAKGNGFDQIEKRLAGLAENAQKAKQDQTIQDLLEKAIELRERGKYDKAIDILKNSMNNFAADPNIPAILSHCYLLSDNLEQAKIYLDAAKNINSNTALVGWNETKLLLKQNKVVEALAVAKKTNKLFPDDVEGMGILGSCLRASGSFDESQKYLNKAIGLNPNYAEALINRGLIYLNKKDKAKALVDLEKAHILKPHIKQIWHLVLNLKIEIKEFEVAISLAEEMVKFDPVDEKTIATKALCYQHLKKYDEAVALYKKAIDTKPGYLEAWVNLGSAFKEQGKLSEAIEAYNKALSINPDYAEVYYNMGAALKGITLKKPNKDLQKTIISILDRKTYVRPNQIAKAAISLLKLEPNIQKYLKLVASEVIENSLNVISDLGEFPLLLKLMNICPLPDLELEKLLKNLRKSILLNISRLTDASPELLKFQSALALQCFLNEYIYSQTEEEEKVLRALQETVKKAFKNGEHPSPQIILALASYKALNEYDWFGSLVVTTEIYEVFTRQISEPNQEEKLKQDLSILAEITDGISSKVRAQYEQSPYPRWINLGLSLKPRSISKVVDAINLKLYSDKTINIEKPEILIAGCGTGQHSIGTAARFKSSKVLAIDLSLSSLAYAKRKTEEFAVTNIEYMQADILDLSKLNKQFDIIESAGVLHHMDNPMVGWKVLTECLKPGGLMKIGLYSELARQPIVKIRKEISNAGIRSSDEDMKSFRDMVIKSDKDHHKLIVGSSDFYSLSELRDLLFHVQEHRFTIPQIKDCLNKLGLKFCGFESTEIVSHFEQTNTHKDDPYDLDKWLAYEEVNPTVFSGMYQFWCQKVD